MNDDMVQYVIYKHPRDYPDHYVLRRWTIKAEGVFPDTFATLADTAEQLRALIPPEFYRLDREPNDDASILEVWV